MEQGEVPGGQVAGRADRFAAKGTDMSGLFGFLNLSNLVG